MACLFLFSWNDQTINRWLNDGVTSRVTCKGDFFMPGVMQEINKN